MKVGIVHGAGINPDGSLQLHTKARADKAIEAYDNSMVDMLIVCGRDEGYSIGSYLVNKGVDREKIMVEPFSYSTLSNLYFCKMLLFLLAHIESVDKVCPISNHWHIPRLNYAAGKILEEYKIECLPADDPRNGKEIKRDKILEGIKLISDGILLNLGYGKKFNKELFFASIALGGIMIIDSIPITSREVLENSIKLAIPSYQSKLMKLERMLYKTVKVI
ncbi:MAG: YdcF family protein [Candidatus Aenigmatarchaeota archaeon]